MHAAGQNVLACLAAFCLGPRLVCSLISPGDSLKNEGIQIRTTMTAAPVNAVCPTLFSGLWETWIDIIPILRMRKFCSKARHLA